MWLFLVWSLEQRLFSSQNKEQYPWDTSAGLMHVYRMMAFHNGAHRALTGKMGTISTKGKYLLLGIFKSNIWTASFLFLSVISATRWRCCISLALIQRLQPWSCTQLVRYTFRQVHGPHFDAPRVKLYCDKHRFGTFRLLGKIVLWVAYLASWRLLLTCLKHPLKGCQNDSSANWDNAFSAIISFLLFKKNYFPVNKFTWNARLLNLKLFKPHNQFSQILVFNFCFQID